jgi:import inner membrane translocase subunit TIM44
MLMSHLRYQVQAVKVLENDTKVFVISFRTQEIITFRDPKTGEIAEGDENKIEQCGYVAVLTRIEEELDNEETGGWKIIDIGRRSQVAFL